MTPDQAQEIIGTLERIAYALEYLGNKQAEAFLSINDKQGVIANSLLQICDKHGSQVPGPYWLTSTCTTKQPTSYEKSHN